MMDASTLAGPASRVVPSWTFSLGESRGEVGADMGAESMRFLGARSGAGGAGAYRAGC